MGWGIKSWAKRKYNDAKDWVDDQVDERYGTSEADERGLVREGLLDAHGQYGSGMGRRMGSDAIRLGHEANAEREYLRKLARGENSVSALQLKQGLQQNISGQQAMANSARPGSGAMSARTAAIGAGRAATGLSGQQAVAGLQERNQAQAQLQAAILGQRQQDLVASQGYGNMANAAWGRGQNGQEGPTGQEKGLQDITSLAKLVMLGSDKRIKKDIKSADKDAEKLLKGLKAYKYNYKDQKFGKGEQLGIMAQDLERLGLGHAVEDTPEGKMVHGGKLAAGLAATLPGLNKRLEKLESK